MEMQYNFEETLELAFKTIIAGRTPAIWGMPGIGKSVLCRKVAEKLSVKLGAEVGFYVLDAPLLQPFDYTVGVPNHETKTVELYPTGFLPQKGPALVCVEDLPHAKTYQMVPLMQIVLDRRIGPLRFGNDVHFIITGNREEDLAAVNPLPSPLYNRMLHFSMAADPDSWRVWARSEGLDDRVIDFVCVYPQYFCRAPQDGVKAWPTPRTLHMLSDIIQKNNLVEPDDITAHATASIGQAAAAAFAAWLKYMRTVDTDAIISDGAEVTFAERGQIFPVMCAVAARVKRMKPGEIAQRAANIMKFFRSLEGEYKAAFIKEIAVNERGDGFNSPALEALASTVEGGEMGRYIYGIIAPK